MQPTDERANDRRWAASGSRSCTIHYVYVRMHLYENICKGNNEMTLSEDSDIANEYVRVYMYMQCL
jgi:hypothetical protein